ncbi:vesicle transport protein SFT2C [Engraulis encrasicolus]|uniref:vesicle transport protein SFT2C n=1 Tax=Engraulis encrasicolus TaxID=184585 RepID=UPI002FD59243
MSHFCDRLDCFASTSCFHSTLHNFRRNMAELNRQLQEYLSQSKGAKTISQSSSSTTIDIDEADSVPGSWFGKWSSPFSNPSSRGSTGQGTSSGFSWPWSSEPDPCLPGMSRSQRLVAFGTCIFFSALCFGLSALYAPLLLLKARKFALLWSLGSLFALLGAAILRGPSKLIATPTPGAVVYLCSLGGTLYAALSLHSTLLTALGAAFQIAAIVGYVVALLPGGTAGMRFVGGMAASAIKRTVTGKTMPI